MHVLITGAAGMIGRKLADRLAQDGSLHGKPVERLTLLDIVPPAKPAQFTGLVETIAADLSQPAEAGRVIAARPDAIFHLAGVVSGEAELDFEKGYRVNLDGTRALLDAIRTAGDGYKPKVIYTSSIAVFGAPFPPSIPDDFHLTPLTSYGTQKAMGELLLADYSRRGFCNGIGIRLPTIVVRPGKPNAAASGFFSGIIREPPSPCRREWSTPMRAPAPRSVSSCMQRGFRPRRSARASISPCPECAAPWPSRSRPCGALAASGWPRASGAPAIR